jgi:mono/diheme cytochrome c family protein
MHLGDCANCHRARDADGNELPFGGGGLITAPDGKTKVAAANLTPDASGISYYDDALFIEAMRTGRVRARELSRAMPWRRLSNLSDEDLKALFAYLRSVKPVRHRVDNAEPAVLCQLCGQTHGGGGLN